MPSMRYNPDHKVQTRKKVLRAAASHFLMQGIENVSVARLMQGAGLTHGGFYSHFASKESVLFEAIENAFGEAQSLLWEALHKAPPGGCLLAVVRLYLSLDHVVHPERGCPLAALGPELGRHSDGLRQVALKGIAGLNEVVQAAIAEDGLRISAAAVVSLLVGGLTLSRIQPSLDAAAQWRDLVLADVVRMVDERAENS